MKRIFTIAFFLLLGALNAQSRLAERVGDLVRENRDFRPFAPLTVSPQAPNAEIAKVVNDATLATLNVAQVNDIVANRYPYIEVTLPYNGENVIVQLFEDEILAPGFHVDTDKRINVDYQPGVYYKGIVKNNPQSVAALSFFEGEFTGIVSTGELNNLVIGKLHTPGNTSDYIIYSDSKMNVLNQFSCGVKEEGGMADDHTHDAPADGQRALLTSRCVTMYFEIDYDIYTQNASSVTNTVNWMTGAFNNVETLYFQDNIDVALKSTFVWTEQDPYEGDGSSDYLYQFNQVRPIFDGDLGQLVGIDPGGLGGVAVTINGMCSSNNFSYSDVSISYSTVPTYSWTVMVITHEMGHLMGSRHTHNCSWNGNNTAIDNCGPSALGAGSEGFSCMTSPPTIPSPSVRGTIMSYCHLVSGVGISFTNGFGTQPRTAIVNAVNNSNCLSTDCINTCINTIASINITNLTPNSVSFTWNDLSTNSAWAVDVLPFNSNFPSWETVSTNSYTQNGLVANAYYKVRIRPSCGVGVTPAFRQFVFATPAAWCSGVTITDTGGANSDYTDMTDFTRVLIPDVPNKKITMTFTSFNLEADYDYLYIYDGNSTAAPLLTPGGLTGTSVPGPFVSTAVDGSLTMRFVSDPGVVEDGFVATVNCQDNLSIPGFEGIDFTYYPNPSSGIVNIVSKTEISEIVVYNPQGRLLYSGKPGSMETKVDISAFATGTYFFKIKFGEAQANFKVLKN